MQETDLAWAAGIIDGEGYITFADTQSRRGFTVCVGVNSTDEIMVPELRRLFGGNLYVRKTTHKPQLNWALTSREAIADALIAMLPYLRVKKDQALELLAAIERKRRGGYHTTAARPMLEWHAHRLSYLKNRSMELQEVL